jgi:hypothetical protein
MVALHGREDALLDTGRFQRLLWQANDAEVADVRKVGEDEYEISPHRTSGVIQPPAPPREPASTTTPALEPAGVAEAGGDAAGRDNGQRFGVRFRRGSRAPLRGGEIPLIGVVQIESPEPAVAAVAAEPLDEEAPLPKKAVRPRAPRKKASATPATAGVPAGDAAESPAPRPRRPRPRAKKKAE